MTLEYAGTLTKLDVIVNIGAGTSIVQAVSALTPDEQAT
jgi:hypothetical protein